ncbi:TPA: amino acid permease [Escherichia coli]|nr:amino acid permease [Escherichia coli]
MNTEGNNGNKPLGLWNVVSIGIGAMVGAGIFALLGQAALLMEASTWVAFAFGGIVAMFSGYAYARLGASYPSNGGIIDFFRRGLGNGVFSLALSLLYLLTLAVSIAMVARAFGAYAVQFLHEGSQEEHLILLYALGIIAVMTLFNSLSNHAVGRLEVILVGIKMMILLLLIIAGVWSLQPAHISVSAPPSSGAFFSCIGITFLAYAGFGMMANAADKVKDPEVIMPRAFLVAIGVTTLLYISLALVLLSDVSALELEKYADTAVAQAASPLLGHVGYVIVVIGALLATASAINANLFAVFNIMDNMGSERELPKLMNKPLWRQSTWGNIIVVVLIMLMTAALNLGSLAWFVLAALLAIVVLAQISRWYSAQHRMNKGKPKATIINPLPRNKVVLAVSILLILIFSKYFYMASISSYYTFYLMQKFGLSIQNAQLHLFAFLFAVAAGTVIGGPVGDKIGRKYVIWGSILGVAPFTLILPYASLHWTGVLTVIIGFILASAFSAILVYAQELLPGRIGMVSGLFFGFAFGMGGLGAAVLGLIADHTSIELVYKICAFLPLLGMLTIFLPDNRHKD